RHVPWRITFRRLAASAPATDAPGHRGRKPACFLRSADSLRDPADPGPGQGRYLRLPRLPAGRHGARLALCLGAWHCHADVPRPRWPCRRADLPSPWESLMTTRFSTALLLASVLAILLFLLAPILVLIFSAFDGGNIFRFPPRSYSLRWFEEAFNHSEYKSS